MITNAVVPSGRFPIFIAALLSAIGCHNMVVPGWLCLYMDIRVRRFRDRINLPLEKLRAGTYRTPRRRAPAARPLCHMLGIRQGLVPD
jgi:hypothetical protein